jgi:hypothetical protein
MQPNRRSLLRGLLGLTGGATLAPAARACAPPTVLLDFAIAGGGFHGLYQRRGALRKGQVLELRREPGNASDGFAIAVHAADGLRLGYVPRTANQSLARLLDAGRRLEARIVGFFDFSLPRAEVERSLLGVASTDILGGDPRVQVTLVA